MSGVKGKSGRSSHFEERTIKQICEQSAEIFLNWLKDKRVERSKRALAAKEVIIKRLPAKLHHSGSLNISELLKDLDDNEDSNEEPNEGSDSS